MVPYRTAHLSEKPYHYTDFYVCRQQKTRRKGLRGPSILGSPFKNSKVRKSVSRAPANRRVFLTSGVTFQALGS